MDDLLDMPGHQRLLDLAFEEDLGAGDVTTDILFTEGHVSIGNLEARQELTVCGHGMASAFFHRVDPDLTYKVLVLDGDRAAPSELIGTVSGRTASILKGERAALNFLQKLSGIATLTDEFVARAAAVNPSVQVFDTRKTTPGFRRLCKYAVRCGGGTGYRLSLSDAAMIKDNHIAAAGSITNAVERIRHRAAPGTMIEVEIDRLDQLLEALESGADVIMLDNFSPEEVSASVAITDKRILLEISGGVCLDNIADYARTGVDRISVGIVTHSAPAADLSLNLESLLEP